jgi:hypothetical protein
VTPLEIAAKRAYEAFVFSLAPEYRPASAPDWKDLPDLVKDSWKAAAAAARESR